MRNLLIPLSILICLSSCGNGIHRALDRIEMEIHNNPDSALYHLENISPEQLRGENIRARFALLESIAFDKNYIDVIDDSLINIALNYYSNSKRHSKYKMLSYYQKGIIDKNAGNYSSAIIAFAQAGELAEIQNNWHYLGLIYRNTADIFSLTNNNPAAIDDRRRAIEAFSHNNDSLYVKYARCSLAMDLMNDGQYEEARDLFLEFFQDPIEVIKANSELCYAQTCVELEDSVYRAIELYRNIPLHYYTFLHFGHRSQAFLIAGQLDSAEYWISRGYSIARNSEERATLDYLQARIDSASNKPFLAYSHVKKAAQVQDSLTRVLLNQSLSIAQRDYYRHEADIQNMKLKRHRASTFYWAVIAFFIVIIVFMLFREKSMQEERALRETITQLELEKKQSGKAASTFAGTLFLEKYAHLGSLLESCYGSNGKQYLTSFKKELSGLNNNENAFQDLYKMLNASADNIIQKLTMQMPSISKDNLKTIALFFAGIPDELIQYIAKKQSISSLKTYRSRLRSYIKQLGCKDEQLFITYLERQPRKKP